MTYVRFFLHLKNSSTTFWVYPAYSLAEVKICRVCDCSASESLCLIVVLYVSALIRVNSSCGRSTNWQVFDERGSLLFGGSPGVALVSCGHFRFCQSCARRGNKTITAVGNALLFVVLPLSVVRAYSTEERPSWSYTDIDRRTNPYDRTMTYSIVFLSASSNVVSA